MHLVIIIAAGIFIGHLMFAEYSKPRGLSRRQFMRQQRAAYTGITEWESIVASWGPDYAKRNKVIPHDNQPGET